MQSTVATLDSLSTSWSTLIVAMLWQSTLLAGVVAAACWLLRRASPAIRYWLWQIVAIKLVLVPIWSVSLPVPWLPSSNAPANAIAPNQLATPTLPAAKDVVGHEPLEMSAPDRNVATQPETQVPIANAPSLFGQLHWRTWLLFGWIAAVVGQVVVVFYQRSRLHKLLRRAQPAGRALETLVAESAGKLGLKRVPRVVLIDEQCSPFVCGVWRPSVVLPRTIDSLVPREQLAPVLTHELAHVQRMDLLWNWIPQIARMLFFFHPVAHWVAFRTRLEAELACDGWAMTTTGSSAGAYADLLIRVVSRLSEPAILRSGSVASAGLDGQQRFSEINVESLRSEQ